MQYLVSVIDDTAGLATPDVAEVSPEVDPAGAGDGGGDSDDQNSEVRTEEYPTGPGVGDRDVDDRDREVSAEEWYAAVAGGRDRDVDDNVPQEYVDSAREGDHDSDDISAEEREEDSRVREAAEAADATSEAAGDGQAAGGSDGHEEAIADPYLVDNTDGQDSAEAHSEIETVSEAGGATATDDVTAQGEHSDDDTLLIPEVTDIVPDGLIENGPHVRSVEWHESDADRAEAPVR